MTCKIIYHSTIVSFEAEKSLILKMSSLSVFIFYCLCFCGQIQEIIATSNVLMLLPYFLLFYACSLFQSLMHFKLFLYVV